MPNWCENRFVIAGNSKDLDSINQVLADIESDSDSGFFQFFVPTPQELLDQSTILEDEAIKANVEKYGAKDWYEWRIKNWGVKWDIKDPSPLSYKRDEDGVSVIEFGADTPWSYPLDFFIKFTQKFKNVYVYCQFYEPGMGFEGYFACCNGKILEEVCVDSYSKADAIADDIDYVYERAIEDANYDEESDEVEIDV